MNPILTEIAAYGVVPVIKVERPEDAEPLAGAFVRAGLPLAEITFRSDAAAEAIARMTKAYPKMLIGAGTVLTTAQVDAAVKAGAKFIVSPGFNPTVVRYCVEKNIPIVPGCSSCGEMEQAMELGLECVKFFPAEQCGGPAYLKAVSAPYSKLKFMATGGITRDNLASYMALPCMLACGGSFMAPANLIKEGKFDEIERMTRAAVTTAHGFAIKHVGINEESEESARRTADLLCRLLSLERIDLPGAFFAGTLFEVMKKPFRGTNGHIGISCLNLARGKAYLESLGFAFDEGSAGYDEKGNLKVIYLRDEIAGFAVHLITK